MPRLFLCLLGLLATLPLFAGADAETADSWAGMGPVDPKNNPFNSPLIEFETAAWLPELYPDFKARAVEHLFTVGWSSDSKMAWITAGTGSTFAGGTLVIQDLVDDIVLENTTEAARPGESGEDWWQRCSQLWKPVLEKHQIRRVTQQPVFFPSIYRNSFYEIGVKKSGLTNNMAAQPEFKIEVTRRLTARKTQAKTITTIPAGQLQAVLPFAFVPSPYENRLAVLILRLASRGGIATWAVAGADLRAGFEGNGTPLLPQP